MRPREQPGNSNIAILWVFLIKQLFHSRLLDDDIVLANLVLRASFAIYHLVSNANGIIV